MSSSDRNEKIFSQKKVKLKKKKKENETFENNTVYSAKKNIIIGACAK
jgi:hypothetical protein